MLLHTDVAKLEKCSWTQGEMSGCCHCELGPGIAGRGTGRAAANGGLHALQLSMLSTAAQLRELTQRVHQVSQLAEPIQTERTADAFPALDTVNQQGQARDVATNDRAPARYVCTCHALETNLFAVRNT